MTFQIYGIRIVGETEVRYVGRTMHSGARRVAEHLNCAKMAPKKDAFYRWLIENEQQLEAVELDRADDLPSAKVAERKAISIFLAIGFRLFNQWLVPFEKRIEPRTENRIAKLRAARAAA